MTSPRLSNPYILRCGDIRIDCRAETGPAHVMGILNVTPDSFSDGGRYFKPVEAVAHAERMLDDGATIIDIGGESTRPTGGVYGDGAAALSSEEELDRILPVIEMLLSHRPDAVVSVDTYKADTARRALAAGATMINDITSLRVEAGLGAVVGEFDVPLILMHSLGSPGAMPHTAQYGDVVEEVRSSLVDAIDRAEAAGADQLLIDPGFGFGKSADDNLRLVCQMDRFTELDLPVLIGLSRKSSIGVALGSADKPVPVAERLYGSLAATAVAVLRGAAIVRCHDVGPTVELLRVIYSIQNTCKGDR